MSAPNPLREYALAHLQLLELAIEIADGAARCDIESNCRCVRSAHRSGPHWYDVSQHDEGLWGITDPDSLSATIRKSTQYLQLRGLLVRDPEAAHIVSFRSEHKRG